MTEQEVLDFAREAIFLLLKLGLPVMLIGLAVGLVVAIFQSLTQIQEMGLTFVPKIVTVFLALLVLLPWMLQLLQDFMAAVGHRIIGIG
ncbi:flagellar biosynthesis protein FliQ [Curvivirga aplysinae]|uniref:flagellar biosynthesis protein FliQ n=1 Tax=Curvivirga aplysinae TaxID=2529852 RepID=UPI0012BC1EC3|nr:flagellar biosynthesis protein FliQ [Curvivirga aplysinae]MTI11248.1 flagellar biosynthesis protein FliQ [Curvivirga aplysinae]